MTKKESLAAAQAVTEARPYRVICISMYVEDLEELDHAITGLKHVGVYRANRSLLIREALKVGGERVTRELRREAEKKPASPRREKPKTMRDRIKAIENITPEDLRQRATFAKARKSVGTVSVNGVLLDGSGPAYIEPQQPRPRRKKPR